MMNAKLATEMPQQTDAAPELQLKSHGILWVLLALYACARVLQVYPGTIPMPVVVALHVFPPAIFAFIHGARLYRIRGVLTFVAITFGIGFLIENLGVHTGFPFGRYYFTDPMGAKVGVVPVMLGLAYVGMAYLSWTLARVIAGWTRNSLRGSHAVAIPALAARIMVSWDLSLDPVWSTVLHAWMWRDGGAYFGVPITNFLGWFLTVSLIYLFFALYLRKEPTHAELSPRHWRQAVIFYGIPLPEITSCFFRRTDFQL